MQNKDLLILSLKKIMKIKMKKAFIVIITLILVMGLAVDSMAVIGDGKSKQDTPINRPNKFVRLYSRIKSFLSGGESSPSSSTGSDRYSQSSPTSLYSTAISYEGLANVNKYTNISFDYHPLSVIDTFLPGGEFNNLSSLRNRLTTSTKPTSVSPSTSTNRQQRILGSTNSLSSLYSSSAGHVSTSPVFHFSPNNLPSSTSFSISNYSNGLMNSTNSSLSRLSNNSQRFLKEKIDFKVPASAMRSPFYAQTVTNFLPAAANSKRIDVLKKNIVDNQKVVESWNNIYNTVQSKNQSTKCAFYNNIDNTNFMLFQFHAVTDQNLFSLGTLENIKLGDISKLDRNSATSRDGAASAGVNDTSKMNNGANLGQSLGILNLCFQTKLELPPLDYLSHLLPLFPTKLKILDFDFSLSGSSKNSSKSDIVAISDSINIPLVHKSLFSWISGFYKQNIPIQSKTTSLTTSRGNFAKIDSQVKQGNSISSYFLKLIASQKRVFTESRNRWSSSKNSPTSIHSKRLSKPSIKRHPMTPKLAHHISSIDRFYEFRNVNIFHPLIHDFCGLNLFSNYDGASGVSSSVLANNIQTQNMQIDIFPRNCHNVRLENTPSDANLQNRLHQLASIYDVVFSLPRYPTIQSLIRDMSTFSIPLSLSSSPTNSTNLVLSSSSNGLLNSNTIQWNEGIQIGLIGFQPVYVSANGTLLNTPSFMPRIIGAPADQVNQISLGTLFLPCSPNISLITLNPFSLGLPRSVIEHETLERHCLVMTSNVNSNAEYKKIKNAQKYLIWLVSRRNTRKGSEDTFKKAREYCTNNQVGIPLDQRSSKYDILLHRIAAAKDKAGNIWVFGIQTYRNKSYYTLERGNFNPDPERRCLYILKAGEYFVEPHIWYKEIGTNKTKEYHVPWILNVKGRTGMFQHQGSGPWHSGGCGLFLYKEEAEEIYDGMVKSKKGSKTTIRVTNSDQVNEVLKAELDAHSHDPVAQGKSEQKGGGCGSWEEDIFDETPLAYDSDIMSNIILDPESLNPNAILCIDNLETTSEHNTNESVDKTDAVEVVPIPDDNSLQMSTNTSSFTLSEVTTRADFDEDSNKTTQQNKTNVDGELNVEVFVDQAQDDNSSSSSDNPLHITPTIISDKNNTGDSTKTKTKTKGKTKKKKKTKTDKETSTDINYDNSLYDGSTNYQPNNIIKKCWALEQFFLEHEVEKPVVTKVNLSLYNNPSNSSSDSSLLTYPTESKASGNPSSVPSPSTQGSKEVTDSYLSNIEDNDNNIVGRQVQKQNVIAPINVENDDITPCNEENKYIYNPDKYKDSKDEDSFPSTSSELSVTSTSNQDAKVEDIISDHVIIEPSLSGGDDKTTENQDKHHDIDKSNSIIKSLAVSDTPDNNNHDEVTPNVYKITSIDFKDDIQRKSDADQVSNIKASTPLSNSTAHAFSNDNKLINNDKCNLKDESNPVWGDSQTDDVEVDQSSDINRLNKQNDDRLNVNKEPTPARGDAKVDDVGDDFNKDEKLLQNPSDSQISSVAVENYESDVSSQLFDKIKVDDVEVVQNSHIEDSNIENDSKTSPYPTENDTTDYDSFAPYNMKPEAEVEDDKTDNKIVVIEA